MPVERLPYNYFVEDATNNETNFSIFASILCIHYYEKKQGNIKRTKTVPINFHNASCYRTRSHRLQTLR